MSFECGSQSKATIQRAVREAQVTDYCNDENQLVLRASQKGHGYHSSAGTHGGILADLDCDPDPRHPRFSRPHNLPASKSRQGRQGVLDV